MKKCVPCNLVYQYLKRSRCLYCNAVLVETQDIKEKNFGEFQGIPVITQIVRDRTFVLDVNRQFILGSYLKHRTSRFLYFISRNEYLMGESFRRPFVQPFNVGSFLNIPWVFINVMDTALIRVNYNGYCESCGWKYKKFFKNVPHDARECEYRREYTQVIKDILTCKITITEKDLLDNSLKKLREGKPSAYNDLCFQRTFFPVALDLLSILVSIFFIIYVLVRISLPPLSKAASKAGTEEQGGRKQGQAVLEFR